MYFSKKKQDEGQNSDKKRPDEVFLYSKVSLENIFRRIILIKFKDGMDRDTSKKEIKIMLRVWN